MQWCNIDMTVRRTLLEVGLPIHYYPEVLFHQTSALRELAQDSLKLVNTVNLPVNSYGAVDLPSDCSEVVGLYLQIGSVLQPMPQQDWINPLRLTSSTTGGFVPYADITNPVNESFIAANSFFSTSAAYAWYWNVNDFGEMYGAWFGATGGTNSGYKVIKERRQIQLTEGLGQNGVIVMYIGNGQTIDNATQIEWAAFSSIQAYSNWKMSPNYANKNSPEATTFYNERRLLRARLNILTLDDILNTVRQSFTGAMKN